MAWVKTKQKHNVEQWRLILYSLQIKLTFYDTETGYIIFSLSIRWLNIVKYKASGCFLVSNCNLIAFFLKASLHDLTRHPIHFIKQIEPYKMFFNWCFWSLIILFRISHYSCILIVICRQELMILFRSSTRLRQNIKLIGGNCIRIWATQYITIEDKIPIKHTNIV